jgi:hypothetical protein
MALRMSSEQVDQGSTKSFLSQFVLRYDEAALVEDRDLDCLPHQLNGFREIYDGSASEAAYTQCRISRDRDTLPSPEMFGVASRRLVTS